MNTTRYVRIFLAGLSCLLTHRATAQDIKPLRPTVVRLEAGDVIREPLIGMDTATYYGTRRYQAATAKLLAAGDVQGRKWRKLLLASDSTTAEAEREIARQRLVNAAQQKQFSQLQEVLDKALALPTEKSLFINPKFYGGVAVGTLFGFFLKAHLSK